MALKRLNGDSSPVSIEEITKEAANFDFYVQTPLKTWLQSAKILLSQAASLERQGDLQAAYLYTFRHAILVLQKLPLYPASQRAAYKDQLSEAADVVNANLAKLEQWKPRLKKLYNQEIDASNRRKAALARREEQAREQQRDASLGITTLYRPAEWNDTDEQRKSLDASEHRHLAVQFAQEELLRRGHVVRPEKDGQPSLSSSDAEDDENDLSRMVHNTRRMLDCNTASSQDDNAVARLASKYNYPLVPAREPEIAWPSSPPITSVPPELPSKIASSQGGQSSHASLTSTPSRPKKEPMDSSAVKFKVNAYTEGGVGLRTVMLPSTLQQKFLNVADPNTARNLETCGVLCASLVSNALIITHLVVPDQTSTSDTCDTTDSGDVALFDYCESQDLIVCGWIHTHPSQTCFLSSRDLHTSSGYQQMLPEAIAIVCAPRHKPSLGIFRLTSPPGLPAVLKCVKPGIFHQHDEQNLYTDATTPGHVVEDPGLQFKLVDLRT